MESTGHLVEPVLLFLLQATEAIHPLEALPMKSGWAKENMDWLLTRVPSFSPWVKTLARDGFLVL